MLRLNVSVSYCNMLLYFQIDLLNLNTLDNHVFKAGVWFSKERGDNKLMKDLVAFVDGKAQLKSAFHVYL